MSKKLTPKEKHINRFIKKIADMGANGCLSGFDCKEAIKREEKRYDRKKRTWKGGL